MDPRLIEHLGPVVQHMLYEHQAGAPVEHVLWETSVAAAFVGMGWHPIDALRYTEALERIGGFPMARMEPPGLQASEEERLRYSGRYPTQEMA